MKNRRSRSLGQLPRKIGFLAIILGLSAGCASPVTGLRRDPSFVHDAVVSGRMAIGGVTAAGKGLDAESAAAYANQLRSQLLEVREDYTVNPVGIVSGALGEAEYKKMMGEIGTGGLTPASIGRLSSAVSGNRYVVFARIDSDTVERDRREEPKTDLKGKAIPGEITIRKIARRRMSVTFDIYDLQQKMSVWNGLIGDLQHKEVNYEKLKKDDVGVALIKAIAGKKETDKSKYPDPEPPTTRELLDSIFRGFARNMPKD